MIAHIEKLCADRTFFAAIGAAGLLETGDCAISPGKLSVFVRTGADIKKGFAA